MITVQQAVDNAYAYFNALLGGKFTELLIEEIEFNTIEKCWEVTLGYNVVDTTGEQDVIPNLFTQKTKYRREYKIFKVDAENGNIRSMKIRKI